MLSLIIEATKLSAAVAPIVLEVIKAVIDGNPNKAAEAARRAALRVVFDQGQKSKRHEK